MIKQILFVSFFISGFCGLVYQTVWLRLALAHFGVITPVISVVISSFMAGIAAGSYCGGRFTRDTDSVRPERFLIYYALTEIFVGATAILVPFIITMGGENIFYAFPSSSRYFLGASALFLSIIIFVPCFFMGLTTPLVMQFLKDREHKNFGFLYCSNVARAAIGIGSSLFLIELFGFRQTFFIKKLVLGNFFCFVRNIKKLVLGNFFCFVRNILGPDSI